MNEKLKFSWGHIIAFLALIFISYVSFVGITYLTDGNFTFAIVGMILIDFILALFFIGAQMLKATSKKFDRCILWERFFVFGSPVVFILVMLPYAHFWTVHSQNDEIVSEFSSAVNLSEQLFVNYEQCANERINNYQDMLDRVVNSRYSRHRDFVNCGFEDGKENTQKENMVKTLRLQLLSENYDSLRTAALDWIESANTGVSTWNVFLLGNIKEVANAVENWNKQLIEFAEKKVGNETFEGFNEVYYFQGDGEAVSNVKKALDNLRTKYMVFHFPNMLAVITAIILFLMLALPYCLQDRHTKSTRRLIENGAINKRVNRSEDNLNFVNTVENFDNKKEQTTNRDYNEYQSFRL